MKRLLSGVILLITAAQLTAIDDAKSESPVVPGAKVGKVADGFSFTEGPAPDAEGNVYFTDQPNDSILKWSTDGSFRRL